MKLIRIAAVLAALSVALSGLSSAAFAQFRLATQGTMIGAGVGAAGGIYGNQKGKEVAQKQNLAAKRENEMKRRLQIASKQLDTARTARKYAEAVAVQSQRKLAKLKAEVKAGRASKQQLAIARTSDPASQAALLQKIEKQKAAINGYSDITVF